MGSESVCFCNYTIGADSYEKVSKFCKPFGTKVLLIGGEKALAAGEEKLLSALADSDFSIEHREVFRHECTYAKMDQIIANAEGKEI